MNPADPPPAVPQRIGAFRVERRLGRGGMGEVFLAWDDRLERWVAIKRIRGDADLSPSQRERFRREARSAARLSHPAVVQVHDLLADETGDAIVMEYVEGETLAARLACGPLAAAYALLLARQIAAGLAAAHASGLIHRDLKAENVIVSPAGVAKILDFGLARPAVRPSEESLVTERGALLGTYHAMSPEQAAGADLDPRSDLFSFGALLYQMLAGRAPFRGGDPVKTLRRILSESPPSLHAIRPDLPEGLSDLVDRLLEKDRADRPADAVEVLRALDRIEIPPELGQGEGSMSDLPTVDLVAVASRGAFPWKEQPVGTPPEKTPSAARKRRRRSAALAALAALALAVAASIYLAGRARAAPLRVAIAPPEVPAAASVELQLAASAVSSALLGSLSAYDRLAVIDPSQTRGLGPAPQKIARAVAAGEVLAASVESREGTTARVTLRRVHGAEGRVIKSATFDVPSDPEGLHLLADAVAAEARRIYPEFRPRSDAPVLDARNEDFAAFVAMQSDLDAGRISLRVARARLSPILLTSPLFLEARLFGVTLDLSLFRTNQDPAGLGRARDLARQAEKLAPGDPRVLFAELDVALASGRSEEAENLLDRLDALRPGDPEVLLHRAELADRLDRPQEALKTQRLVVTRAPSWRNVFYLAMLEARNGLVRDARERLAALARQEPTNSWVRVELGNLEMMYGDLHRAEALFRELVAEKPRWGTLNYLGTALFLSHRPRAAIDAYRQALKLAPDQAEVLANLGEAEIEIGDARGADADYRRALARFDATATAGSRPIFDLLRAQCLARLGRGSEAVDLVQGVLRRDPADAEIFYRAALVEILAGDRQAALSNARQAIARGYGARWFARSAFGALRNEPELRSLLNPGTAAATRSSWGRSVADPTPPAASPR
jgi:serine/threonine-protein kinase